MIGYLAAIESRDLSPAVRDTESENQPRHTVPVSPILPRLPSEYETWRIAAVDQAAEMEASDEVETLVTSSTTDTHRNPARGERGSEVNPSVESPRRQVDSTASTGQTIDSKRKTPCEPASIATTQPRHGMGSSTRELNTPRTSERRRENVVVRSVTRAPVEVPTTGRELTLPSDPRRTKRIDTPLSESSHAVIIPQVRESVIAPSVNSFGGRARHTDEMTAAEKSEPSVVVTIGRIEVRAVTRPSQPRSAERQQMMSLDDYLKQRIRGLR